MKRQENIVKTGFEKKILAIAPYTFLPASSGGQKAIYYLYQHLGKQVDLTCVSTGGNLPDKVPGKLHFRLLPLLGNGVKRYINPANYRKLKKLVNRQDIEAIIIEHPYTGWLGWLLKATTGVPLIVRSHNIESLRFKELGKWWWRLLADYERWVHRKASHSFFITREDAEYAITEYGIRREKTSVITYGLQGGKNPTPEQKRLLVEQYKQAHGIPADKTMLLFNGIFGYRPNDEALELLLEKIYPALLHQAPDFHLIICGANIPAKYLAKKTDNLTVLGFVPDIEEIFLAAEVFLNPIWLGGGIKTKLVEALAGGASAVSFTSGAIGVDQRLLDGKLKIVPNKDTGAFISAIIEASVTTYTPTSKAFLDYFDWDQIARKANLAIRGL